MSYCGPVKLGFQETDKAVFLKLQDFKVITSWLNKMLADEKKIILHFC